MGRWTYRHFVKVPKVQNFVLNNFVFHNAPPISPPSKVIEINILKCSKYDGWMYGHFVKMKKVYNFVLNNFVLNNKLPILPASKV